jgi:hypothetical protein
MSARGDFHPNFDDMIGQTRAIVARGRRENDVPKLAFDTQSQLSMRTAHICLFDNAGEFERFIAVPAPTVMRLRRGGERHENRQARAHANRSEPLHFTPHCRDYE